jgi:hypothetical protein
MLHANHGRDAAAMGSHAGMQAAYGLAICRRRPAHTSVRHRVLHLAINHRFVFASIISL